MQSEHVILFFTYSYSIINEYNSNFALFNFSSVPIPYVSSSAHSKLLIRAILLKDMNMLESLLKDTQKICSVSIIFECMLCF